jgi:site-specific DNA recombinase
MLCEREKVSDAWMSRVLRLAFLSPAITGAIFTGRQPAGLNGAALLAAGAVPVQWREQERMTMQDKGAVSLTIVHQNREVDHRGR